MDLDHLYLACLLLGLPFSLMSGIMAFLCGAFEATAPSHTTEANTGTQRSIGKLSAFRPTVVSCFVTLSGGMGLLLNRCPLTSPAWISLPLSLLGSLGMTGTAISLVWLLVSPTRRQPGSTERFHHARSRQGRRLKPSDGQ